MAQVIDMEHKEGEAVRSRFKSVCVFCGSSKGKKECYEIAAIELGQELVSRKLKLVYGGGCIGLMGCVAQAVQDGGGKVLGIIPRRVLSAEITGETVGREMCVTNMHQRKAEMSRHSNCFIALPGGFGTFDELLEVVSWAQLGIHDKPVGVLNVDGFFNALLAYIDNAVAEGFIDPCQRHIIVVATNAKELLQKLEDYVPVHESALSKESWEGEEQHQKEIPDVGFNIAPAPPVATAKQKEMALEKREKKRRRG